jgi:hypothetical protein
VAANTSVCNTTAPVRPDAPLLGAGERLALELQRRLGQAAALLLWPLALLWMRWLRGYRIDHLAQVRRRARGLLRQAGGAVLICPNHLTWIDSLLVQWAISSPWELLPRFHRFAWNVPEANNFSRNLWLRCTCYLAKCLPIRRGGERGTQRRVLIKLVHLLRGGEAVMLFPEGGRSRAGRVDPRSISYGAGRIANSVPGCRVLCVYLRGEKQQLATLLPQRNQRFRVEFALLRPIAQRPGLRAARETALLIGETLAALEKRHFAAAAASASGQRTTTNTANNAR